MPTCHHVPLRSNGVAAVEQYGERGRVERECWRRRVTAVTVANGGLSKRGTGGAVFGLCSNTPVRCNLSPALVHVTAAAGGNR